MARKLGKREKLLQKARDNPQNLRFSEFCKLAEFYGMKKRKNTGSHIIYKRSDNPKFTLSIQDVGGFAKPYQIKQLIDLLSKYNLLSDK